MGYVLKIGSAYTFDWDGGEDNDFIPEITPRIRPVYKEGASKQQVIDYYVEEWTLKGLIYESTPDAVWQSFEDLVNVVFLTTASAHYDVDIQFNGTSVRKLSAALAIKGLQYTNIQVQQGDGTWSNNVIFTFTVTGKFKPNAGDDLLSDIDRSYEKENAEGVITERWRVSASGPDAKDYIISITAAGLLRPTSTPWDELVTSGHDIPIPLNVTTTILQEAFDRDRWTAIFEKTTPKGQQITPDEEVIPGLLRYSERFRITGGFPVNTALPMFAGPPVMAIGRLQVLMFAVTITAACETRTQCDTLINSKWDHNFPRRQFANDGGYDGTGEENTIPVIVERDAEGKAKAFEVSIQRNYMFKDFAALKRSIPLPFRR